MHGDSELTREELSSQVHHRLIERLAASERHYREMIETLSVPVFEIEADGTLTFVNQAWTVLLGHPKEDSVGRRICEMVEPDDRERVCECFLSAPGDAMGREHRVGHARFRHALGSTLIVNASFVGAAGGRLSGFLQDVTVQQEAQAALERALRNAEAASHAKSQFLANMSHEIRTPIGVIMGVCEVLAEDGLLPEERVRLLRRAEANGTHVLALIGDILDLARIEAGRIEVNVGPCDLRQLIGEVADTLRQQAGIRPVTVSVEHAPEAPCLIHSDATRLRQILLNLGGNALKFTPEGSVVIETAVVGHPAAPVLAIHVRDTGIGIDPSRIAGLFEPFQQADVSHARRFNGAGLGLSIARGLAHTLGGDIEAASAVGVGSVFSVHLPAAASAPWGASEPAPEPIEAGSARILLAEDNEDLQALTRRIVAKMGLRLEVVGDGRAALETMARAPAPGHYDLVLMDMQMPGLDGYAATREIRRLGYRGPVVALTAHAMKGDRERCLAAGCDDYVAKPVSRNGLRAVIARHVGDQVALAAAGSPSEG